MRSAGLRRARLVGLAVACAVGLVPTAGSAPGPLRPPVAAHAVSVASSPVSYAYDPAGRLSAVTTDAGSATYAYDPVGNILSIARLAPGTVAVFQFYPRAGSTGTAVTISGAGFDPVPANDTVRFNGTPAAVESASSTSLVVTVPAGANTGPISVQTGGQTATSSAPFTVHGDLAPAITSVAPTQIVPGDPVTITGSNFSGDRTLDDVSLDGTELRVLSANATTVTATLPDAHRPIFSDPNKSVYATGSGHVTVATPAGRATSGADVYVGAPDWDRNYLVPFGRFAVGSSIELNAQTGRHAMALFEGRQGQRIFVRGDDVGPPVQHINFFVIAPHRFLTLTPIAPQTTPFFSDALTLPSTGTYAIVMDTSAGGADWRFAVSDVAPDVAAGITPGGAPATVTTTTPGQNGVLNFAGRLGQRISLRTSDSNMSGTVSLVSPDHWRVVDSAPFGTGSGTPFSGIKLPRAGGYQLIVDPAGDQTGHVTVQLARGALSAVAPRPATVPGLAQALAAFKPGPEDWIPGAANRRGGNWRANRRPSPWSLVPALRARPGISAVAGQLLRLNGAPLAGATIELGHKTTRTDRAGRFLLTGVRPGQRDLMVLGGSAALRGTYGRYCIHVYVAARQTNVLPFTVWMPRIDWGHGVSIPTKTRHRLVITTPRIPGLEVIVPAGTRVTDGDGHAIHRLSITPVPLDRPVWPLPQMAYGETPAYYTIQPGGAYVHGKGLQVIYPNYGRLPARTPMTFWHYDPEKRGWYGYGAGSVAAEGKQILPARGTRVWELTGYMVHPDPPATGPLTCSCQLKGDPVDPRTGLFVLRNTDLVEQDVMPVALDRVYRQNDTPPSDVLPDRPFGMGATSTYQMAFYAPCCQNKVYLYLADGGRVLYKLVSPTPNAPNAAWKAAPTPSEYAGSYITYNRELGLWQLTLRDGSFVRAGAQQGAVMLGDRHGNEVSVTSWGEDRINVITSPNGRWVQLKFGSDDVGSHVATASDALGRAVHYSYDGSQRLVAVTDPAGGVTRYAWSGDRITSITNPRGFTILRNEYTKQGRIKKQVHSDGGVYTFSYKAKHKRIVSTTVVDPRRMKTGLSFDKSGYLIKETRAARTRLAETVTIRRQKHSPLIASYTDPLRRKTALGYDGLGNVTKITRLAGTKLAVTSRIAYDLRFSEPSRLTDPLRHGVSVAYDVHGDPGTVTDQVGRQTQLGHDLEGRLTSVTDPLGHATTYAYEGADRVSVRDPLGRTASVFEDAAGQPRVFTDPRGEVSSASYTALGEPASTVDPLGDTTAFLYDADGNLARVTDANGHPTGYDYDALDRVAHVTDALGRVTTETHDRLGRLTRIAKPSGRATSYTYDLLGRLTAIARFAPGAGRAQSRDTFLYDRGNRVLQARDSATGAVALGYDPLDRLIAEATPEGLLRYAYDKAGRRKSMQAPHGQTVTYAYNAANQLLREGKVTFAYDPAGRLAAQTFPSGVSLAVGYDAASEPTSLTYAHGASQLGTLDYSYAPSGQEAGVNGSLAIASLPSAVTSATYDAANELTRWNGVGFTYDGDGNLTGDGVSTYSWDAGDRLASASGPSGSSSYAYDSLGRRVRQTAAGSTTSYLYDGANVLQELSRRAVKATLLPGPRPDQYFRRTDAAGARDLLPDAQGSTIGLADPAGTLITQYSYEPYGQTTVSGQGNANEFLFHGMPRDASGLSYDRARYYSAATGRFASPDPIGLAGGSADLYQFAGADAVNLGDPTGLSFLDSLGGLSTSAGQWWDSVVQSALCALNSLWSSIKSFVSEHWVALAVGAVVVGVIACAAFPPCLGLVLEAGAGIVEVASDFFLGSAEEEAAWAARQQAANIVRAFVDAELTQPGAGVQTILQNLSNPMIAPYLQQAADLAAQAVASASSTAEANALLTANSILSAYGPLL